jgi:hypothetical protein
MSPIYYQKQDGIPERLGRLQLRYIEMQYHDTTGFDVQVTPQGRAAYTIPVAKAAPRDGNLRFAVLARAEDATIAIVQDTAGGCRIGGVDWEGYLVQRARR